MLRLALVGGVLWVLVGSLYLQGCQFLARQDIVQTSDEGSSIMQGDSTQQDRIVTIYGEVTHVNRLDLDKSGRNPSYQISLLVAVEKTEGVETGLTADSSVKFQGKETEILKQISQVPQVGDRVVIESIPNEPKPRILGIRKIQILSSR